MGPPSTDGWNMVGGQSRTPFKSIDRSIDPTKMKISKVNTVKIRKIQTSQKIAVIILKLAQYNNGPKRRRRNGKQCRSCHAAAQLMLFITSMMKPQNSEFSP